MKIEQLQEFFPPERRRDIERLYQRYLDARRGESDVAGFVSHLHDQGLLSTDTMRSVLTEGEVTLSALPDVSSLDVGSHTKLLSLLGKGAMGEVFLGHDPHLKRTVAVKRLDPKLLERPAMAQRFFAEAQITAQLDHPSIVPIYGLERDREGRLSYAMKFVRGKTLKDYMDESKAQLDAGHADEDHTLKARIETLLPALNAMDYAHKRGIIHRDLKPDNIMVGAFGEVLVMDWGIARPIGKRERVTAGGNVEKTRAGSLVGTPSYMSPEQAAGNTENLDAASDQYSLGLILQELVTLKRAIVAESALEVVAMAAEGIKVPIAPYKGEDIPRELEAIIHKATARDPDHRYESVDGLGDDLRRFLRDESVIADPDTGVRRLKRWVGRHRGLAIGLVFGLVALIGVAVTAVLWQSAVAMQAERDAARRREGQLQTLTSMVAAQAMSMTEKLNDYEALLQGIVAVSEQVLQEPAPDVPEMVVYKYKGSERDPPERPPYAIQSPVYDGKVSLKHSDFSAPPDLDLAAHKPRAHQLWRVQEVLRKALLASIGPEAPAMPLAEAEKLVLEEGAPLVWTYVSTVEGLTAGMPGIWDFAAEHENDVYDPRIRDWFTRAKNTYGPVWSSSGVDESGLGLLITCARSLYDRKGEFLGVAAVDLTFNYFIDHFLENETLMKSGGESLILDDKGIVVVRSSQKDQAKNADIYKPVPFEDKGLLAEIGKAQNGHLMLADKRLAVWGRLAAIPWTYVVVAEENALLATSGL